MSLKTLRTNEGRVRIVRPYDRKRGNRRIGGLPSFHERLESVARQLVGNAESIKGSFLLPELDVLALRQVLDDKPAAYDNADLEEGRALMFSAIREALPTERAEAMIECVKALVEAEVDTALESHGVRAP